MLPRGCSWVRGRPARTAVAAWERLCPARILISGGFAPCGRDARVGRRAVARSARGGSEPSRCRRKRPSPWGTKLPSPGHIKKLRTTLTISRGSIASE